MAVGPTNEPQESTKFSNKNVDFSKEDNAMHFSVNN